MRLRTTALAVAALASLAGSSRATFTAHLDALTADVDDRIAALTGTLTKPQKTEKAQLTALSKALHKKSTTFATDLKIAASAAKLVDKSFSADATMPGELGTALDGFYADVIEERNALAVALGLPERDANAATLDVAKADADLNAQQLGKANAAVDAGERAAPSILSVTPLAIDFGTVEPGVAATPQTIMVGNASKADGVQFTVEFPVEETVFYVLQSGLQTVGSVQPFPVEVGFTGTIPGKYVYHATVKVHAVVSVSFGPHPVRAGTFATSEVTCTARVKAPAGGGTTYSGPLTNAALINSGGPLATYEFDGGFDNPTDADVSVTYSVTVDGVLFGGAAQSVVVPAKSGTRNGHYPVFRVGAITAGKHTVKLLLDGQVAQTIEITAK